MATMKLPISFGVLDSMDFEPLRLHSKASPYPFYRYTIYSLGFSTSVLFYNKRGTYRGTPNIVKHVITLICSCLFSYKISMS